MSHICGMYKSNMLGIQDASSIVNVSMVPKEYDLSGQTRPMIDQGNQGICVSVSLGDIVTFAKKSINKNVVIHTDYFYRKRNDKNIDGMTPREAFEIVVSDFQIKMFAKIQDIDTMKKSIIMNGPCMACLPCYNDENVFWKGNNLIGGHAVVFTGFDKNGFILKNSWGWQYGNNGYYLFPYEDWKYLYEAWTLII